MKKKAGTYPKTKGRYDVYLVVNGKEYFSKSYKSREAALARKPVLNKKWGRFSYKAIIKVVEEVI